MKRIKKVWVLLLCMSIILPSFRAFPAEAAELKWKISKIKLDHKKISFTINQVENAQNATIVVLDDQYTEILSQDFSISKQKENIAIDLEDGKSLPAVSSKSSSETKYYLYVKDEKGNVATDVSQALLYHHEYHVVASAYPEWVEIAPLGQDDVHISAKVDFKTYEGVTDENGIITIKYPRQRENSSIQLELWDDFGCFDTFQKWVQSEKNIRIPDINVWRDGIKVASSDLNVGCRLAVRIGDEVYYSNYNAGKDGVTVDYPTLSGNVISVTVWVEDRNGIRSEEKAYGVKNCDLKECSYDYDAYPKKADGIVEANKYGQLPVAVSTTINGEVYQTDIIDGEFTLEYPYQVHREKLKFVFTDKHGCSFSNSKYVEDTLRKVKTDAYVKKQDVLKKSVSSKVPEEFTRLCVKVGGKVYYSDYYENTEARMKVTYPEQKVGTKVKVWFEAEDSSFTDPVTYKVYDRQIKYSAKARTTELSGKYYSSKKAEIIVTASGKKYKCDMFKDKNSRDGVYYDFSVSYPKQKVNSYIKIKITDIDGYSRTEKIKLKNIPPKLSVSGVNSGSTKITGKTAAGAKVTAKINGKKYKGKANKSGKYTIKIKPAKVGSKIKITSVTSEGYTRSKTVKIKLKPGIVSVPYYIFRTSTTVTAKVQEAQKGDLLKVNVGGIVYTTTIKKAKKSQHVTVNINPAAAGTGVVVTLCDRFGKVKSTYNDMVYFGDTIYIGMSAEDACLTTWGFPQRNNWGGIIQWVYKSGSSYLYVYIQDGKVAYMQRINY